MTEHEQLISIWEKIIIGTQKSWALFENGTCVIFTGAQNDLEKEAKKMLETWGLVVTGTPSADFGTIDLEDAPGWVVTCHHNDILTYVGPDEVNENPSDLSIGLLGRSKQDYDAEDLLIIYTQQGIA